jgi:hypothetical protein
MDTKIFSAKSGNAHTISSSLFFLLTRPTNKEKAECSETTAHTIPTQGYHSKEKIKHLKQSESLESRIFYYSHSIEIMFLCFREKKPKETKHPEYLPQIKKN